VLNRFFQRYGGKACIALHVAFFAIGSSASVAADDHDRARQALEAGQVQPLRIILERVEREYPGQVIDVELEREGEGENNPERWVYKIKMLRSGGTLIKLKINARDGTVIGKKVRMEPKRQAHHRKIDLPEMNAHAHSYC
jgi:hypothetical protein